MLHCIWVLPNNTTPTLSFEHAFPCAIVDSATAFAMEFLIPMIFSCWKSNPCISVIVSFRDFQQVCELQLLLLFCKYIFLVVCENPNLKHCTLGNTYFSELESVLYCKYAFLPYFILLQFTQF